MADDGVKVRECVERHEKFSGRLYERVDRIRVEFEKKICAVDKRITGAGINTNSRIDKVYILLLGLACTAVLQLLGTIIILVKG